MRVWVTKAKYDIDIVVTTNFNKVTFSDLVSSIKS
jgi:hypothetical protein